MTLISAYYDESENQAKGNTPPMICVGGYFFEKENALLFESEWRALLSKYQLSHFSMGDCNSQWGEFKKFSDEQCIVIQTEFMEVLKRRAMRGFAASMNPSLGYLLPSAKAHGIDLLSPYAFCSYWCLFYGRTWGRMNNLTGRIAYFYERGYLMEPEFTKVIGDLFSNEALKKQFFYASHAFADKRDVPQLQAADILAWQMRMNRVRAEQGKASRRDFVSLLDVPTDKIDFDESTIQGFLEVLKTSRLEREERLQKLRAEIKRALRIS